MATKLLNPVIRRIKGTTSKYKIIDASLLPAEGDKPELIEVSARNPRKPDKKESIPLLEALVRLFPWLDPQADSQDTPVDAGDGDQVGMEGMVDATELESVLMVDDQLAPFPLRARIWYLVRALRENRDPEYQRYGASCQVFPLEDDKDLTHLEVQLSEFKVVFARHGEESITVALWKDFREVFDDRQMTNIAGFAAVAVAVLRKHKVAGLVAGDGIDALEQAAHRFNLLNE